jgi:L-ascorbate metabolism protein UlaG (beta-lactamase superfamily)
MFVTYTGHSGFLFEVDGQRILIDPFITGNPHAESVMDRNIVRPDIILLTHGHGDHIGDTIELAKQNNTPVVAIYEIATWLETKSVTNTIGMNLGGSIRHEGIKIQMVPAWHSSTLPDGTAGGVAVGRSVPRGL